MYNKDVIDSLIREFGLEKTIIYCKLEARKNDLMHSYSRSIGEIGSSEWEYERDWWAEQEQQLLTLKQNKNENGTVRTFRKKPKIQDSGKAVVFRKITG